MKPPRLREFVELGQQLTRERAEAEPILMTLRQRLPLLEVPPDVPNEWRTLPVVDGLCGIVAEQLERSPAASMRVAELAIAVADVLDPAYPNVLQRTARARAWRALGDARRATGDPERSLSALDHARSIAEEQTALAEDTACIDLSAARTLIDLGLTSEASQRLQTARSVFGSLGLAEPVAQCDELLHSMDRHMTSHDENEQARSPELERIGDELARLIRNEIRENVSTFGAASGRIGNARLMGVFALEFLLLALLFALFAAGLPAWAASLIVGLIPAAGAMIVARRARQPLTNAAGSPLRNGEP